MTRIPRTAPSYSEYAEAKGKEVRTEMNELLVKIDQSSLKDRDKTALKKKLIAQILETI